MKKSIRGSIRTNTQTDKDSIVADINKYTLWRLNTNVYENTFIFEAWVNNENDKNELWSDMKRHVDALTGKIDWHYCSHDEEMKEPCVIVEEYERVPL